ncbi:MAG: AAA family ATPase [Nocardioidaceae bacterium]
MTTTLRLLGEVTCRGEVVAGARPGDLLAALALHPAGRPDSVLVDRVWGDDQPAAPAKALQVLVSRLRAQAGADLIDRRDGHYRLGLAEDEVDLWVLERLAARAREALRAGELPEALGLATDGAELLAAASEAAGDGPLAEVRRRGDAAARSLARTGALALARGGRDAEALPRLLDEHARDPDDAEVLVALLRSEAATAGAPAALSRFERHRQDVAERLGVDPDPTVQQVHRELLSADQPVRRGLRYDLDELLGRDQDLARLRGLVRTGRLTSILGPGGLGKTRVAHVLAREATQPRVHFVELVGVSSPSDVLAEVGSALGVRDSVTGRRTLSPGQLADVRARIAQELDTLPTLLVLDNCEHVLDAVAGLVAFLLATTRDLHVVTTSRAPLGIAAERVFPLSQLEPADGSALFRRRALAARPDAELPDDVVADIVDRLDGLPLAIELAAARVRAMSVEQVRGRLVDRFELLRSRDRTVHARHQTLTAVIAWSWDLLDAAGRRALARLSVFHDGFTVEGAEALLGRDGPDLVEDLVDQSLLVVAEQEDHARYRMLETVREYGARRLAESGDAAATRAAHDQWARAFARQHGAQVFSSSRQFEAIDALWEEENNLADVLRRALADADETVAFPLLAALGGLWAITGNHARVLAFADLAERLLLETEPTPDLVDDLRAALTLLLTYVRFMRPPQDDDPLPAVLARLGVPTEPWPRVTYAMFVEATDIDDAVRAVVALADHPNPEVGLMALQWAAVLTENGGSIVEADDFVRQALARIDDTTTPWQVATLHTQAAQLALQKGQHHVAAAHGRVADPLLTRLRAVDDALHARTAVAIAAILEGDLEEAQRIVDGFDELPPGTLIGGAAMTFGARAELHLARGDVAEGLAAYEDCMDSMRSVSFTGTPASGLEPWVIIADGAALAAYVRHAHTEAQRRRTSELAARVQAALTDLAHGLTHMVDFPVTGMGVFALGGHAVAHGDPEHGLRLLALAHRFGYNRSFPVLAWEPAAELAARVAPGRLDALLEEYAERPGGELLADLGKVLDEMAR